MEIIAESYESLLIDRAVKTESRGTFPDPFARNAIGFRVVVTHGQVLVEVVLRVRQVGLSLRRKHRRVLNCRAKNLAPVTDQQRGKCLPRMAT